jgi:hypothetical protein
VARCLARTATNAPRWRAFAQELGYTGALDGSAEMNVWLHKQVMAKLMKSGDIVPDA